MEAQKREVAELQKTLESKQDELDQLYEQTTADLMEPGGGRRHGEPAGRQRGRAGSNEPRRARGLAAQKAAEEAAKQEAANNSGSSNSSSGGTVSDGGKVSYPTTAAG